MLQLYTRFKIWGADDEGATAVEYGILVAAIAAVIVAVVGILGGKIDAAFEAVNTAIKTSPY
jgi:pilus assembly protein Flp/PilA